MGSVSATSSEGFECIVEGIPISANNDRKAARAWRSRVAEAGARAMDGWQFRSSGELSALMVLFHTGIYICDTDNIPKHVLDALKGLTYEDDRIITQVTVRRTQLTPGLIIADPPPLVAAQLGDVPHFLYIYLGEGPDHRWLPN